MRTDRAQPAGEPGAHEDPKTTIRSRWRLWLPFVVKPLRRGVLIFALVLIIEYLVVPELVGASKDLNLLGRVNPAWLVAGADPGGPVVVLLRPADPGRAAAGRA